MCILLPTPEQLVILSFMMVMGALASVGVVMMPVIPIFIMIVVILFAVAMLFADFLQRINRENDPHGWPVIQGQNQEDPFGGYHGIIWAIISIIWGFFTLRWHDAQARPEEPADQQPNEDDPPDRRIPNGGILRRRRR